MFSPLRFFLAAGTLRAAGLTTAASAQCAINGFTICLKPVLATPFTLMSIKTTPFAFNLIYINVVNVLL